MAERGMGMALLRGLPPAPGLPWLQQFLEELDECPKPMSDELMYAVVNVYQSSGCI